jgi:hypothetical protein
MALSQSSLSDDCPLDGGDVQVAHHIPLFGEVGTVATLVSTRNSPTNSPVKNCARPAPNDQSSSLLSP